MTRRGTRYRLIGFAVAALLVLGQGRQAVAAAGSIRYSPGPDAPGAIDPATGGYVEGASFDPLLCAELPCVELLHNIFEPLVSTDLSGDHVPVLATRWQRLDDHRFRFWLRQGVRFHNGEKFDAGAVVYSLQRASEIFALTAWFPRIEEVSIVAPDVVDVVLAEPDGLFLYRLGHLGLMLPPRHIRRVGLRRFGASPVGTGPFRFDAWDGDRREIRLTANERYWREGHPRIGELIYVYADADTAFSRLIDGELDIIQRMNPRRTTQFMASGAGEVVKAWLPHVVFGIFNLLDNNSPLHDPRVREALNLAINRPHMIRYGALGNGRLLGGYSIPEGPAHAGLEPPPLDLARARRLIAEAGLGDAFTLSMSVSNHLPNQIENIIVASLEALGVTVESRRIGLYEYLQGVFLSKFGDHDAFSDDIILAGTIAGGTLNHPGSVPMAFLYSKEPNEALLRDAELDRLYEAALATYDPAASDAAWRALERYVREQNLLLFGYQERAIFGVRRGLHFTPRTMMSFWDAYYEDER
jgi:peptide/nickel transport system substrate-binding protein